MKALWHATAILLLLHALGAAGGALWLYRDGRLDRQRLRQVKEIFALTIEEQRQQEQRAEELRGVAAQQQEQQAWRESVRSGPATFQQQLGADQVRRELAAQQQHRFEQDRQAWLDQLALLRRQIEALQEQLRTERSQFDQQRRQSAEQAASEGFRKALELYEQSKPRQVKLIFADLIANGQMAEVVDYLAAMAPRQAAAVLKEFKAPAEISLARQILEALRRRDPAAATGLQPPGAGAGGS